jgi:small-conductance mechanosensitive channel
VTVLRRLAIAIVVVLGMAAILMTFPAFSNIGTTLFASAGVLSVVAGLAAQTSLGAVFAGMQIAFSGAIRVGDVVQLENGQWWGRIEEITLSYVVVRLWDERRLVLPSTYFTTEPFENWTRSNTEIMAASSSTSTSPSRSTTCVRSWTGCWPKANCGTAAVEFCR